MNLLLISTIILCAAWLGFLLVAAWHGFSLKALSSQMQQLPPIDGNHDVLPALSIIVAACNDAEHLRSSLPRLLALEYPRLEVVVVNDRSSDGTQELLEQLAAHDARLQAVHVSVLPEGWLGKVHALHCGVQRSSGAWLLFTDADILFEPTALQQAVWYAECRDRDHLVVLPELQSRATSAIQAFWVHVFNMCFAILFFVGSKARNVAKQGTKAFIGMGAFNLVRRSAFDHASTRLSQMHHTRLTVFEWLKMEVVDDVGLGMLIKRYGRGSDEWQGRSDVVLGNDVVGFEWYPSLAASVHGIEKNAFAAFGEYKFYVLVRRVLMLLAVSMVPFVAGIAFAAQGQMVVLIAVVAAMLLLPGLVGTVFTRLLKMSLPVPVQTLFVLPLGFCILCFALVRSAWYFYRRGGIVWRGTLYTASALREGFRLHGS
jgi:glycosyltransferase involved in cell wall biosynthesis